MDFNGIHLGKNSPAVGDVHVSSALGNSGKKRRRARVITTVGETATLTGPTDVTALNAVDFNHVHLGKLGPGQSRVRRQRRRADSMAATVGQAVVEPRPGGNGREQWDNTGVSKDHPPKKFEEIHGIVIAIETRAGEKRQAKDDKGDLHDVVYDYDYGRIQAAHGPDGDQLDVYLGPDRTSSRVFVINQVLADGGDLSDVKIMLGFAKKKQAKKAFEETHFDGHGHQEIGDLIETTYPQLKEWITGPDTRSKFPKELAKRTVAPTGDLDEPHLKRTLIPFARGMAKNPFPVHKHALSEIRPDQTPRLFEALTHKKKLDKRTMRFSSLTAIQDRVDPQKVEAIRTGEHTPSDRAIVVKFAGRNYIVDGDHHLAARWLDGKNKAKVRFLDITARTEVVTQKAAGETVETEEGQVNATFKIHKVDTDKQQIFGWASVSTIKGLIVTDKQDDRIYPIDLEHAAYDYVLNSRVMGHMHEEIGVGRMIESCAFTEEKQKAMGIDLEQESWWLGFQVDSKKVWGRIKSGELRELSIGGVAVPVEV